MAPSNDLWALAENLWARGVDGEISILSRAGAGAMPIANTGLNANGSVFLALPTLGCQVANMAFRRVKESMALGKLCATLGPGLARPAGALYPNRGLRRAPPTHSQRPNLQRSPCAPLGVCAFLIPLSQAGLQS